jgi:hypothetical protein
MGRKKAQHKLQKLGSRKAVGVEVERAAEEYDVTCGGYTARVRNADFRGGRDGLAIRNVKSADGEHLEVSFAGEHLASVRKEDWESLFSGADDKHSSLTPDERWDGAKTFCRRSCDGAIELYLKELDKDVRFGQVPDTFPGRDVSVPNGQAVSSDLRQQRVIFRSEQAAKDFEWLVRDAAEKFHKDIHGLG